MAVRLFVGNLPYSATEAALREHFSVIAPLSYIYLPIDRESGKPRGFAFVEFSERSQAEEAIRRFNNQLFMGRPLAVNEARERDDRPQSGGPPRSPSTGRLSPEPPGTTERGGRSFGPDAAPRRSRKPGGRGGKSSDRNAPKQPIRERPGGRFFGDDGEESAEDDLSGDNFASRVDELEDE